MATPLPENVKFQRARGLVRTALTDAGVGERIDALVARLLDEDSAIEAPLKKGLQTPALEFHSNLKIRVALPEQTAVRTASSISDSSMKLAAVCEDSNG